MKISDIVCDPFQSELPAIDQTPIETVWKLPPVSLQDTVGFQHPGPYL